ncbi:MAG: hypothetical protein KJ041_03250 [Gammaproteobacteria bacterium]|nr:hypothetical protein [Gammaproteobacteria bacterium]
MNFPDSAATQYPFSGPGHLRPSSPTPAGDRDPYTQLDELMVVVEALCPARQARGTLRDSGNWRL